MANLWLPLTVKHIQICITYISDKNLIFRLRIRPRVLRGISQVDLSTTILGERITMPIGIAPTATQKLAHPDGELATARGKSASADSSNHEDLRAQRHMFYKGRGQGTVNFPISAPLTSMVQHRFGGMGLKMEAGCEIREILREGYKVKISWQNRDALIDPHFNWWDVG